MKFKVGDKVRLRSDLEVGRMYGGWSFVRGMQIYKGKILEIAGVNKKYKSYSMSGLNSWVFTNAMLEPVVQFKPTWRIIIEGDENTSRAKYIMGKKIIKEVSAKRYHKDKHSPATAARALIGKMFPETKEVEMPKYFTGRVVCVERPNGVWLTVGKIYKVIDGVMECEEKYDEIKNVTSVENLNSRCKTGVKFIEIKE